MMAPKLESSRFQIPSIKLFDCFQVAEMHGELLEFNEHLQKTIQSKDVYIKRLRDELVNLK